MRYFTAQQQQQQQQQQQMMMAQHMQQRRFGGKMGSVGGMAMSGMGPGIGLQQMLDKSNPYAANPG